MPINLSTPHSQPLYQIQFKILYCTYFSHKSKIKILIRGKVRKVLFFFFGKLYSLLLPLKFKQDYFFFLIDIFIFTIAVVGLHLHFTLKKPQFTWIIVKTKWHTAKLQCCAKVGQSSAQNLLSLKSMTEALWNILHYSSYKRKINIAVTAQQDGILCSRQEANISTHIHAHTHI